MSARFHSSKSAIETVTIAGLYDVLVFRPPERRTCQLRMRVDFTGWTVDAREMIPLMSLYAFLKNGLTLPVGNGDAQACYMAAIAANRHPT